MDRIMMMRRIIMICIAAAVWMTAAFISGQVHAAAVTENVRGTSVVQNLGNGSDGKGWKNPHYNNVSQYLYTIRTGGEDKYGYCFQSGKQYSRGHAYTAKRPANASAWTNLASSRQRIVRLALFYGYNNGKSSPVSGANTNDYYAATQALIWEAADGNISLSSDGKWSKSANRHDDLITGRTGATACYNWMKNKISRHVKGPSFGVSDAASAKTYTLKYDYRTGKWNAILPDSAKGNYYKTVPGTSSGLTVSRSGYNYSFAASKSGTHTAVLMNSESDGTSQEMIVFRPSDSGKQAILIGATDTTSFYAKFKTEKTGKGTVTKENSDGSSPEGFQFLVENKSNGYSRIHTTDASGKIQLELYPGTYTVTEILTEEQKTAGFVTPAGGQLKITEGGTASLEMKNQRKQIPYQIQKTSDNGQAKGFVFVVETADGKEVCRGETDAQGIVSGNLYPGEYVIREELTEDQIKEGYRAAGAQELKVTSQQSGVQIVRFHNMWDPIKGKIAIRKTVDDGGPLDGFVFDVEGTEADGGTYVKRGCVTDETGQYLTDEVEPGVYTVTEVLTEEQALRYEEHPPVTVEITEPGNGAIVGFTNRALRTSVSVHKICEDGKVGGIEFEVTGKFAWGQDAGTKKIRTDDSGRCSIDLQPGTYTFTESGGMVDKYKVHPPETVTVTGKESPLNIKFINIPKSITLIKCESLENGMKTDTPVAGAVYEVYRSEMIDGEEVHIDYGRFTTDEKGTFTVKGTAPGKYYFSEVRAPNGYERNEEPAEVEFKKDDFAVEVTDHDRRAYGRITLNVKDGSGAPVEADEIGIYLDPACSAPLDTYVTDDSGRIQIEKLPWGTYYIKEITSARGYEKNNEVREVRIGKDGVTDAVVEILKVQKKGKILLTKTDETGLLKLAGAEFSLYRNDGTMADQKLLTDENGELLVKNLDWGGYYFQETAAPDGYGMDTRPVRFSVNATTGGVLQELTVKNRAKTSAVIIEKKIRAEDLYYDHGIPAFTFILSGTTVDGEAKRYAQQVSFSEDYVRENTGDDGYVTGTVMFTGLKAGSYSCTEKDTIRYEQSGISIQSGNGCISEDGKAAEFVLEGQDSGYAVFTNEKTDWRDFSDSASVMNVIKAEKKLTALAVEFLGPETLDGNMPFDAEKYLEVTAFYDDGSERALSSKEYIMLSGDGVGFERTDIMAGQYTISVQYTENGITRGGSFSFRIEGVQELDVEFETGGGTSLESLTVWKYDMLADFPAEKYITEKEGSRFTGWFLDAELSEPFSETELITENLVLYAGWEPLHLSDYSWDQLKEISEAGKAPVLLGECFETVKEDLSDDGYISAENFRHTKAFDCQGSVCHAVIAGFGQDEKPDGTKAGITFLVYEPLPAKPMILPETGRTLGWDLSHMRTTVLPEIYENLPHVLKDAICPVVKTDITKKDTDISVCTTQDLLWLPSKEELYGTGNRYMLFESQTADEQGTIALSSGAGFWTRSLDPSLDRAFYYVDAAGNAASQ